VTVAGPRDDEQDVDRILRGAGLAPRLDLGVTLVGDHEKFKWCVQDVKARLAHMR
jgi:hypothetical protein